MTRAEKIAELAEKAKRMREKAAQLDNEKRRILRAEEKAQRAIDTRWKIIYGAAAISAGQTSQLASHISAKDKEWMATHPMSRPKKAEPQKQSPSQPAGGTSMRLVDGELRSFDAQGNQIPAPVANPAPNLVQRMFKQ